MSYADFTKLYGTTAKAKFWCDYMNGLKGQLHAIDLPKDHHVSVWSRVATNEVLLYDVLFGEYFKAPGNHVFTLNIAYIKLCVHFVSVCLKVQKCAQTET